MLDVNKPIKVSRGGVEYDARIITSDRFSDDDLKLVILAKDTWEEFVVYAHSYGEGYDVGNQRDVEVYNPVSGE